jgi:hypothetical protein
MEGFSNIMLITRFLLCCSFLFIAGIGVAQEEVEEIPVEETDPLEAARARGGDIIVMKSGAIMSGVQILRSTPRHYEVHLSDDVEPLKINRRLVQSVEYDDIDLIKIKRREDMFPDVAKELGMDGEELSPTLLRKLKTPITDVELAFEETDYLQILNTFIETKKIPLQIHDSVNNLKPEKRVWSVMLDKRLSLVHFLQKNLLKDFPNLHCKYELNSILLMTQKARENMENAEAEAAKPPKKFTL